MPAPIPYKVGLTGGIGSGKTTVAKIFQTLGVPVYYADEAAKRLMNEDPALRGDITVLFGPGAYTSAGLDRALIAQQAFGNPALLQRLNALVHPVTLADARRWMAAQAAPYVMKEAAILFEAGGNKDLDFIVGVTAPESLRLHRVIRRDRKSETEIRLRMSRQMPEAEKMTRCDAVIVNDEVQPLLAQVLELHQRLLGKAVGERKVGCG